MQTLHMTHPDQVDDLPMEFAAWVLQFAATERAAQQEADERANRQQS